MLAVALAVMCAAVPACAFQTASLDLALHASPAMRSSAAQLRFRQDGEKEPVQGQDCGQLASGSCTLETAKTMNNNNYACHSHKADFVRPLPEVMREHPDVDGTCYFNGAAMYINTYPSYVDYEAAAAFGIYSLREMKGSSSYKGLNSGPLVTYNWEGESVRAHADRDHYLYDDLYGYSLGVLQGQGLDTSLLSNSTAWEEVSAQLCQQVQQEYQFKDEELVLNDLLDMNIPILAQCYCAAGVPLSSYFMKNQQVTELAEYKSPSDCKPPTKREFARHHYMKCLISHKLSADDIGYLHARACLLEDGRIGHYDECPYTPPGLLAPGA